MKKNSSAQYRPLFLVVGIVVLYVSAILQTTSHFTPYLAEYPSALFIMANMGRYVLLGAVALAINRYYATEDQRYAQLSIIAIVFLTLSVVTRLGDAFQLALAGLTVGGSLIVLGSTQSIPKRKSR